MPPDAIEPVQVPGDPLTNPAGELCPPPGHSIEATSRFLMRLAVGCLLLFVVLAIASARCLYADGSNFFLNVLERQNFAIFANARCFANQIIEFPLVLGILAGVRDLDCLRWLFGLGCFLPWLISLFLCHRLAPRHFWLAALACAVGYLNTSFPAVGEYNVAHAFFWPVVFALLFVQPLTPFAAGVLLVSAAILMFSYESLLFLGPLLAILAVYRAFDRTARDWPRAIFVIAAVLFLVAAEIALDSVRHPDSPANFGGFKYSVDLELTEPAWTVGWSFAAGILLVLAGLSANVRRLLTRHASLIVLAGMILLWGAWPLLAPANLEPERQYSGRFLDLAVPLALLPVALALAWHPAWMAPRRPAMALLAAVVLLGQSLWHISATLQWHSYVKTFRQELALHSGLVAPADTRLTGHALGAQALRFDWNWANPSLSIALSPDGKIKTLLLPYAWGYLPQWMPIDVFHPETLPRLEQYGVDYSGFVASLPASLTHWSRTAGK